MEDVLDQIDQEVDVDQVDDQQQDDQQEQQEDVQQEQPAEKVDGRKFNPEWSKSLKELRELYPQHADMLTKLRDDYARYGAIRELGLKGVDDVKSLQTTINAIGGPEAAAELMSRAAQMDEIDSRLESGDFSVISELPESIQKGVYQMLPDMLNHLSESGDPAFTAAVTPHFQSALAATGLGKSLDAQMAGLVQLHNGSTDPEVRASLKEIYRSVKEAKDWYTEQTQGAGKMPNGEQKVSPEVQRLRSELQARQAADNESFVKSTSDAAVNYKDETGKSLAAPYVKSLGLTEAQQSDLLESFGAKITSQLEADAAFQKQLRAYGALKNRNPEQIQNYIKSSIDRIAKTTMDGLVTARYSGVKRRAAASTATTTSNGNGTVAVAKAPDRSQWDMDKMQALGYDETVKKGIFHLQGGKTVRLATANA